MPDTCGARHDDGRSCILPAGHPAMHVFYYVEPAPRRASPTEPEPTVGVGEGPSVVALLAAILDELRTLSSTLAQRTLYEPGRSQWRGDEPDEPEWKAAQYARRAAVVRRST